MSRVRPEVGEGEGSYGLGAGGRCEEGSRRRDMSRSYSVLT